VKLLSFGEVLWDLIEGRAHIGGAPFNLAAHAVRLGAEAWLVSAVGDDDLGSRALERVRALGVNDDYLRVVQRPTGIVDVEVDADGRPTFDIRTGAAWDFITLSGDDLRDMASRGFNVVCYGSLAQRGQVSRETLRTMLDMLGRDGGPVRFCDINLRPPFIEADTVRWSIAAADILKLNDDEARLCCDLLGRPFEGTEAFCRWVADSHGLEAVCVTLGAQGCLVYAGGRSVRCPGVAVKVADTVGAGDAFSAAFLLRYLGGADPEEAGRFACRVGAFVASKAGAVPDYSVEEIPRPSGRRIRAQDRTPEGYRGERKNGRAER